MSVEVLDYRLEVRGVAAGRQIVRSKDEGRHVRMEAEATFEGPLPSAKVVQLSRFHRGSHASYEFQETTKDRSGERRFRVVFDGRDGLVKLEQGNDSATAPYIEPFRDPLSMLRELREAPEEASRIRMPMLGKTVEARALGVVDLDTPLGSKRARAYQLFPGGSWAWVDAEPPHAILRFRQRTDDGLVDAILTAVSQETKLNAWNASGEGGGKKRSRRRRRRRGGRSRSRRSSGSKDG